MNVQYEQLTFSKDTLPDSGKCLHSLQSRLSSQVWFKPNVYAKISSRLPLPNIRHQRICLSRD